jgi:DNA-binding CsgD family transcriptional regulator
MNPTPASTTVEAWLEWFATEKQAACRAYLCTRYSLNALDAEALINAGLLQVVRYWDRITNPLAYMWQTVRHSVFKQEQRDRRAQQQQQSYAQEQRRHSHIAARTAAQVATVLAQVAPRQRQILGWYAQGYSDAEVAGWLTTTPQAVRVARQGAYRALRAQLCPLAATAAVTAAPQEGKIF